MNFFNSLTFFLICDFCNFINISKLKKIILFFLFFLEKHLTLFILEIIMGTLLWSHNPKKYIVTKNCTEISWRHLRRSISFCKMENCQDFSKDNTVGVEQRYYPSFTCKNLIIDKDFWKPLSHWSEKMGIRQRWTWDGNNVLEVHAVEQ